jgi:c-di-GMP-binding flagellar brake protein YcgR
MATLEKQRQQNRRRSRRVPARSDIKVQCRKGAIGLGPNLVSRVLDISETGVRLVIARALDDSAEVDIAINSHGMKGMVRRLGIVRWQLKLEDGQFCVGIEFHKCLDYTLWQNLVEKV